MANRRLGSTKRKKYKKLKIAKKSSLVSRSVKSGDGKSDSYLAGLTGASLANSLDSSASRLLACAVRQHTSSSGPLNMQRKGPQKKSKKCNTVRVRVDPVEQLRHQRSLLLKRHMRERVALRDHTRELEQRRESIRRGAEAKTERRELGKYIRQLKNEQRTNHAAERSRIEAEMEKLTGAVGGQKASGRAAEEWEDVSSDDVEDVVDEAELHDMFAHLMT